MTDLQSTIFVFVLLPLIFIAIWIYVFFYNRRIKARIKEIEGPQGHLDSVEAGIAAATVKRSARTASTR
jgi:hypothetical protein